MLGRHHNYCFFFVAYLGRIEERPLEMVASVRFVLVLVFWGSMWLLPRQWDTRPPTMLTIERETAVGLPFGSLLGQCVCAKRGGRFLYVRLVARVSDVTG